MRRSCFTCGNHETCTKVREVCKSMVFRLRKFDNSFLDITAKGCKNYMPDLPVKPVRKKKEQHPGLFDL